MVWKAAVICLSVCVAGCGQKPADDTAFEVIQLRSQLQMTTGRLESLEKRVDLYAQLNEGKVLKRGDSGFAIVKSDVGGMTAEWKGISDLGGVASVKIRLGNTSASNLNEIVVYGGWGALDKEGNPTGEEHFLNPTIRTSMPAGSWVDVQIPINGAKAADVGYVKISSISVNSLRMNLP